MSTGRPSFDSHRMARRLLGLIPRMASPIMIPRTVSVGACQELVERWIDSRTARPVLPTGALCLLLREVQMDAAIPTDFMVLTPPTDLGEAARHVPNDIARRLP